MCGYKFTIMCGLILREVTRIVLLFAPGVYWASFMQLTYAGATSINYVYYAYVYMVVDKCHFPFATAAVHAAYHVGNVLGSILGQVLVDYTAADRNLRVLFYASWAFTTIGFVFFFALPSPRKDAPPSLAKTIRSRGVRETWRVLQRLYVDKCVIMWSSWWIFGLVAHSIVSNYYQNQFYDIEPNGKFGYVEAFIELFDAIGSAAPTITLACGLVSDTSETWLVVLVSALSATACVLSTTFTESIWISYICNVVILSSYAALSSLACASISKRLDDDDRRFALVFTANSFVALALATLLAQSGSASGWTTSSFYVAATVSLGLATVVPICLSSCSVRGGPRFDKKDAPLLRRRASSELVNTAMHIEDD